MPVCGSGAYTAFWLHTVGARKQEYSPEGVRHGNPEGKSPAIEIDIFEWLGKDPKRNLFNVHFTKNGSKKYKCPCNLTREFHTWAIHWEEGKITLVPRRQADSRLQGPDSGREDVSADGDVPDRRLGGRY